MGLFLLPAITDIQAIHGLYAHDCMDAGVRVARFWTNGS
jgi:hypothetical protein